MKLFAKKEQNSDKKPRGIETAKKAAAKAATAKPAAAKAVATKPARLKKPDTTKKVVKKTVEGPRVWVDTARGYLREVVVELKKVIWPSRKETMGSTAIVLVIVGLSAVFLGIVDLVLSRLVKLLVG
jgi:preprotein translocase subunit SecE